MRHVLLLAALALSCGEKDEPDSLEYEGAPVPCEAGATEAQEVLATYCAACHGGPGGAGGLSSLAPEDLVDQGYVVPGDPGGSTLYTRVADLSMPPSGSPRPEPREVEVLRVWVECGFE